MRRRFWTFLAIILAVACTHPAGAAKPIRPVVRVDKFTINGPSRTIHFPSLPMGRLFLFKTETLSKYGSGKEYVEAVNDVQVPENMGVRLELSYESSLAMDRFKALKPDDLQALDLDGTAIKSDSLKYIEPLRGLVSVSMRETEIDDSALSHLAGLKNLREIILHRTSFSDKALKYFEGLKKMEILELGFNNKIDGSGLRYFHDMKNLKSLNLSTTRTADGTMIYIAKMPLKELHLSNTKITDKALPIIGQIKTMYSLDLSNTGVSDEGLKSLDGLSHLAKLNATNTLVTKKGAAEFLKRHPDCKLAYGVKAHDTVLSEFILDLNNVAAPKARATHH